MKWRFPMPVPLAWRDAAARARPDPNALAVGRLLDEMADRMPPLLPEPDFPPFVARPWAGCLWACMAFRGLGAMVAWHGRLVAVPGAASDATGHPRWNSAVGGRQVPASPWPNPCSGHRCSGAVRAVSRRHPLPWTGPPTGAQALARPVPVLLLMAGSASAGSRVPWHTALTCASTARAWMDDGTTPRALQAVGTGLPLNRPGWDVLPVGLGHSVADDGSRGAFTDTPQHGFGCRRSTRRWRGQCPQGAVPP